LSGKLRVIEEFIERDVGLVFVFQLKPLVQFVGTADRQINRLDRKSLLSKMSRDKILILNNRFEIRLK
jgi:hypothetical protein